MDFKGFLELCEKEKLYVTELAIKYCVYLRIINNSKEELTEEEETELIETIDRYVYETDYISEQIAFEETEQAEVIVKELSFNSKIDYI